MLLEKSSGSDVIQLFRVITYGKLEGNIMSLGG